MVIYFCCYFTFRKCVFLHLNKLEYPSPKAALFKVWLKLAQCFWRIEIFKNLSVCFHYAAIFFPWKIKWSSFEQISITSPIFYAILCLCQVWLKLAQWFWMWRFSVTIISFPQFCYNLLLQKGLGLDSFNQTWNGERRSSGFF